MEIVLGNYGSDIMKAFNSVYKDKVVLVTGHTGFKGSWLSVWLNELGARVVGYSLDPYSNDDNFIVSNLKNRIVDIRGDIRDSEKLGRVFKEYRPEFVFHLAAQPLVRLSYDIPKETYEINVMGTLNVLECIRECDSVKVGIMITTDKCYENTEQIWGYKETDPMGGYDPYSSSKGCAELLISSYRNSYFNLDKYKEHGKLIASVRAGNVIGGGDWAKDRIVPDCIRSLMKGKEIIIRNPEAVRPWQHVLEPLRGYLLLGSKMYSYGVKYSGAWNFGPNHDSIVPVKDIVNILINRWGDGRQIESINRNQLHEANMLSLDITKARTLLKWEPSLNIRESIELTVDWYKAFIEKENMYEICRNQILDYQCKTFELNRGI